MTGRFETESDRKQLKHHLRRRAIPIQAADLTGKEKRFLQKVASTLLARTKSTKIRGFTTIEKYDGIPIADAVYLPDRAIAPIERLRVDSLSGSPVYAIYCSVNHKTRLVGLEYRGLTVLVSKK